MPTSATLKSISLAAAIIFTTSINGQSAIANPSSTSTSSFNWDSLISAADISQTTFDLYTTNGSLGPGVLDTSSRFGLYSSATPVVGPIGNGTVANGTATNGTTGSSGVAGVSSTGTTAGGASSGAGASGSGSGSPTENAGVSAPAESGNAAAAVGGSGLWVEGAGLLVGIGALMAAL